MTVTSAYSLTSRMAVVNSRNVRRRRAVSEPVRSSGTIHLRPRARSSGWDGDAGAHACGAALRHGVRTSGSSTEGLCAPCAGCACRRTAGMPDVDRIGSRGTCGNRRLPWSRGSGCTAQPASHQLQSRAGTAIRRSAARSVVSGPDCDTDRRCVRRSGLGGRGEEVDVVVAAVAGSHHWPRRRRRIIIGPIGLTIGGCAGRQRDPAALTLPVTDSECGVAARRRSSAAPGDHRRPSNHWSSGQFPAHPRPALRHRATR